MTTALLQQVFDKISFGFDERVKQKSSPVVPISSLGTTVQVGLYREFTVTPFFARIPFLFPYQ